MKIRIGLISLSLLLSACSEFSDGKGEGDASNVPAPAGVLVASADQFSLEAGARTLNTAAPGLLANDLIDVKDELSLVLTTPASYGELKLQADGAFSYTPSVTFKGEDSFSYQLQSGVNSSESVSVTITDPNYRLIPVLGVQPGPIAYWDNPYFADAMAVARWLEMAPYTWGDAIDIWNNPQFDNNGFPQYLNEGKQLRAYLSGLHMSDKTFVSGHVVLTWKGTGDLRLSPSNSEYLESESSGPSSGSMSDGRRVYRFAADDAISTLEIFAIDSTAPISDIHVWLADPADPQNRSLEGELWNPRFLERMTDVKHSVMRTMDFNLTNASPQMEWSDRRRPEHFSQHGILNPRNPAPGALQWNNTEFSGNRSTGIAFEYFVDLANRSEHDLWITIPHLANQEFIENFAKLIRYGSDGNLPYEQEVANPVYPPLKSYLKVWVEFSNEIWAGGSSFAQGDWAELEAAKQAPALTKAQFNARKFCNTWHTFNSIFAQPERIVKVLATFTAGRFYSEPFFSEVASYCPSLDPTMNKPDVIAITTYFGNGIQDWADETAQSQASSSEPWFFTTETFDRGGKEAPVSLPIEDAYWTSSALESQLKQTFEEWKQRALSGDAAEGSGPDSTGVGGGFSTWINNDALTYFGQAIPLVAYEGGPSIYTDGKDGSDVRDDGITNFMVQMNSRDEFEEIYRIQLNMAVSKGLYMHNPFFLTGSWSKYGQWGHLRFLSDEPQSSPKYRVILEWAQKEQQYNPVFEPKGAVPEFSGSNILETSFVATPFEESIEASGGDGELSLELIGSSLLEGVNAVIDGKQIRVSGTALKTGTSYIYAKVSDSNGDRAWQIFTLRTIQRSADPAVTITFDKTPTPDYGVVLEEPFIVSETPEMADYQFTSRGNGGLALEFEYPDIGWFTAWPSTVLRARNWNGVNHLERGDGKAFDLYSIDLASPYGGSATITATGRDGYKIEKVVNLPAERRFVTLELDLVEIFTIDIAWHLEVDGQGDARFGAIDNLVINKIK